MLASVTAATPAIRVAAPTGSLRPAQRARQDQSPNPTAAPLAATAPHKAVAPQDPESTPEGYAPLRLQRIRPLGRNGAREGHSVLLRRRHPGLAVRLPLATTFRGHRAPDRSPRWYIHRLEHHQHAYGELVETGRPWNAGSSTRIRGKQPDSTGSRLRYQSTGVPRLRGVRGSVRNARHNCAAPGRPRGAAAKACCSPRSTSAPITLAGRPPCSSTW